MKLILILFFLFFSCSTLSTLVLENFSKTFDCSSDKIKVSRIEGANIYSAEGCGEKYKYVCHEKGSEPIETPIDSLSGIIVCTKRSKLKLSLTV